jgi:hypothetical protein
MMNNGRYIGQKVKDSELASLLGDDWIRKHTARIRQWHVSFQRSSWNKVLGVLKLDNNSLAPNAAAKTMKDKIKLFNTCFEEICEAQSGWVAYNDQMREDLRMSIMKLLLPAYQSFIGRLRNVPELGKHVARHIKYGAEEIEARINGLFQGNAGSAGHRK